MKEYNIGDGATLHGWSDRYPATIIAKKKTESGNIIYTIQEDNWEPDEGHDYYGVQKYIFYPNEKGSTYRVRWNEKKQRFTVMGEILGVTMGERDKYHDPHF